MKNLFNKLVAVLFMAAATVGVSCSDCDHEPYDDTEIKQQIADLYSKVSQLESKLNADIASLQGMISGLVTVTGHTQDANGNWTIKLSDGTTFVVYAEYKPEALPSNLIYVMDHNGEKVWAVMGADGQLTPMIGGDGNTIPVVPRIEKPELSTKIEGGYIYISIDGGTTWVKTGIEAVESVEITSKVEGDYIYISIDGGKNWIKTGMNVAAAVVAPELETKVENGVIYIRIKGSEEWIETGVSADNIEDFLPSTGGSGAACACNIVGAEYIYEKDRWGDDVAVAITFTLSDGSTFTVALDSLDANEAGFYYEGQRDAVTTFYLEPGTTNNYIELRYTGLVDIIKEVSEGWKMEIPEIDPEENYVMTKLTAPTAEAIAAQPALANGFVKLFAVFEDGTTRVVKMTMTSGSPFQTVSANSKSVKVQAYTGVQGFVYGVVPASEYNADTIKATVNAQLANDEALTVASWDGLVLDSTPEEIYGKALEEGVEYIFYTAAYVERQVGWNFVMEVASEFETVAFQNQVISFVQTNSTFNTIEVEGKMAGFDTYYAVFSRKDEFNLEEWLSYTNMYLGWGIDPESTYYLNSALAYTGSIIGLPFVDSSWQLNPDTEYVICVVPAEDGKTEYTTDDAFVFDGFKTGSLSAGGTITVATPTIEADFTSAHAMLSAPGARMIYYYFYAANEVPATESDLVADMLAKNMTVLNNETAYAHDLTFGSDYVLAVMAVDNKGVYTAPQKFAFSTPGISYDSAVTVTIDEANSVINQSAGTLTWSASGEVKEFLYFINTTDNYAYMNTMGGTPEAAAEWMLINQTMYQVQHTTTTSISQNFYYTKPYILIVIAVDNEGKYSKPATWEFTPSF